MLVSPRSTHLAQGGRKVEVRDVCRPGIGGQSQNLTDYAVGPAQELGINWVWLESRLNKGWPLKLIMLRIGVVGNKIVDEQD